jgi:thiol:disulfide interchange protein DsbD
MSLTSVSSMSNNRTSSKKAASSENTRVFGSMPRPRPRYQAPNWIRTGGGRPQVGWLLAGLGVIALCALASTARADTLSDLEAPMRNALQSGSWGSALGLAFAAGVATSLTPCVYPMIVITVSVFGARQSTSKLQAAKLSTAFVLGIAALFTPLGVIAALSGNVFGAQLANPIVLVVLALFFVALAASMLGAFNLDLPSGLKNRLAMAGGDGLRGAFVVGLASSLIAAPCTGPVVGFMLTWVGTTRNVMFGALSFFSYSIGLGLLSFLVGTFSMSLPKSGNWLEGVKGVFGIVMLTAAVYFVRDLIPGLTGIARHTTQFLGVAIGLFAIGVAIGGVHLSYHHTPMLVRARKTLGIAVSVAGLCGVIGYLIALPPGARIKWLDDYGTAKQLAMTSSRPLLVDFGASWCGACGELDRHTFSNADVVREGQRFVPVHVDLSPGKDSPEKQALLRGYNQRGLPLVVLHDHSGREVARVTSFLEADKFLALLRKVD